MYCTGYSVGAIYLVVQNLPRQIRYKMENIILVGVIPGPKEPKLTMNSYLYPLVQEMKEFWLGVSIPSQATPLKNVIIRAAITCCASDIPASRKLCGFVGHSAKLGCSKCSKEFTSLISSDSSNEKRETILDTTDNYGQKGVYQSIKNNPIIT